MRSPLTCVVVSLLALVSIAARAAEENPTAASFQGGVPRNVADLKAMQQQVQSLAKQVIPATVAVQVGQAQGSGVIISADGFVLTAAHVATAPGRTATVYLHDGTQVRAKTLGLYRTLDAGLVKIDIPSRATTNGEWPHAKMGNSANVAPGQWCLSTGHPGGIQDDRAPVLRLGRVISVEHDNAITTDCTLIGGDSGGPLFDLKGNVIGVNSRIGSPLTVNLHVPVNSFRAEWARLARGDAWGHLPGEEPFLGVQGVADAEEARIKLVVPGTPAAAAGVRKGDVILRFNGKRVTDFASLQAHVGAQQPGNLVHLLVQRGRERVQLDLRIGRRPEG